MSKDLGKLEDRLNAKLSIMQIAVQGALREMDTFGGESEQASGLLYSFWELRDTLHKYREKCHD